MGHHDPAVIADKAACCPTCGRANSAVSVDLGSGIVESLGRVYSIPRKEAQLLACLLTAHPRGRSRSTLVDALYGDDPDGGPDGADETLSSHVCKLRKKLEAWGVGTIVAARHIGYTLELWKAHSPIPGQSFSEAGPF